MKKIVLAASLLLAAPAFAQDLAMGTELGTTPQAILTALSDMGWDVRKVQAEDGLIEAYAVMGKQLAEIYVDPTTGRITRIASHD